MSGCKVTFNLSLPVVTNPKQGNYDLKISYKKFKYLGATSYCPVNIGSNFVPDLDKTYCYLTPQDTSYHTHSTIQEVHARRLKVINSFVHTRFRIIQDKDGQDHYLKRVYGWLNAVKTECTWSGVEFKFDPMKSFKYGKFTINLSGMTEGRFRTKLRLKDFTELPPEELIAKASHYSLIGNPVDLSGNFWIFAKVGADG